MATGDQNDCFTRLKSLLPIGWFSDYTPVLDAILTGIASSMAFVYSLITYAKAQTRIATASDIFLDLISFDFFGYKLPRRTNEQDNPFRSRILATLLRERVTRNGMAAALIALTGRTPVIFEPGRIQDTGAYNMNTFGWGAAGGWGSLALPMQAFVTAYRPGGSGIPYVAGYGVTTGAFNTASQEEYASLSAIQGNVTDQDIYDVIDTVKAAGTIMWTRILS